MACSRSAVTSAPAVPCYRVPCLGALRLEELLCLVARSVTAVTLLSTGTCRDCPQGSRSEAIRSKALREVNLLYPRRLKFADPEPQAPNLADHEALPSGGETMGRREFLARSFSLRRLVANCGNLPKDGSPAKAQEYRGPGSLAAALALSPPAAHTAPLAQLAVSSACLLCQACSLLCPGEALHLETSGERTALTWQASRCTGCGLCRSVCPVAAMNAAGRVALPLLVDGALTILADGLTRQCRCGTTYQQLEGGPDRCLSCRDSALRPTLANQRREGEPPAQDPAAITLGGTAT